MNIENAKALIGGGTAALLEIPGMRVTWEQVAGGLRLSLRIEIDDKSYAFVWSWSLFEIAQWKYCHVDAKVDQVIERVTNDPRIRKHWKETK